MPGLDQPLTEAMFYILLVLHQPMHGYGITQTVIDLTDGRVRLGAGTLYGALKTMTKHGWIEQSGEIQDSRGKKAYRITEEGKDVYKAEVKRLKELLRNAERMETYEEV